MNNDAFDWIEILILGEDVGAKWSTQFFFTWYIFIYYSTVQ